MWAWPWHWRSGSRAFRRQLPRLRNEAALAALCGVRPLSASSGKVCRHRLNGGCERLANNALWTIAMVRMRSDARTREYVARRTREGLAKKEIHRCLERYIRSRVVPAHSGSPGRLRAHHLTWKRQRTHGEPVGTVERWVIYTAGNWRRQQAMDEAIDWLAFHNHRRLHSTLGYVSPMKFEKSWQAAQLLKVAYWNG